MRGHYQGRKAIRFLVVALATATIALPSAVDAGSSSAGKFTATPLTPDSTITSAKSASGQLAQSDPALLGRTDATPVHVVVKLDYDATASYEGDIAGLAATSPKVTGEKLTGKSGAERAYENYTGQLDKTFRSDLASAVPAAQAGQSLQRVYGGVAVTVPANQISKVLGIDGVAAVQSDVLNKPDTIESPEFIGAPTVWAQTGGQALAGKGVIFGDIDTGLWPENPMVADNPALGTPPAAPSGVARECNYGDNPLTGIPFVCNSKVIGGAPFIDTYNAVIGGEIFPDSARDSNGHGTHTTTTAAGDPVTNAPIFGIDRGPVSGVAPGAWVIEYKVCGVQGCFSSDSANAVAQAILDGVNVINFSISGGSQPFSDPVELAFLDAYNAGITVAASAGNSGPGAGTTDHHGPWVITVAASTQSRQFQSTLTVTSGVDSATFVGTSLTAGVPASTPIVLAENIIPGYSKFCLAPLPPGTATGKIVVCQRGGGGGGRVEKGSFLAAGGAAGMILYNLPLADTESDNHFLPAIHLADGTDFLAFLAAHPGATGTFTDGVKADGQGDVMAAFSSRGPGGQFLKPDITAPGVQILAGNTPVPDEVAGGLPGQNFQAIAGTSMSSPHIAGSALLMKALHSDWTPGEIKSALMTTATTDVVKEDLVTPADPFDFGAGRVDLTKAGDAAIVFEDTAQNMFDLGQSPVSALNVNLPSINVPVMPGTVTVTRTATNVTGSDYRFDVSTVSPAGSKIKVSPDHGKIRPGKSQTFKVTITSRAPEGQYFGQINFDSQNSPDLHLPVAFVNTQGDVTLTQTCDPTTIRERQSTTCTVTAQNNSNGEATVSITSKVSKKLQITSATGAMVNSRRTAETGPIVLSAPSDGVPDIAPSVTTPGGGYVDLGLFSVDPIATGDESNTNFDTPPYLFGGNTYTRIGVDSNGYINVGGSDSAADIQFVPQTFPDPAAPNGVLAPYWTDLNDDGTNPALSVGILTDGVGSWIVVQWDAHVFGDPSPAGSRRMQVWIGINGVEDISYEYDTDTIGVDAPPDTGLTVGAESIKGTEGAQIVGPPAGSYAITSTPGTPGGSAVVTLTIRAKDHGTGTLTSSMVTDVIAGKTIVSTKIQVTEEDRD